MASDGLEVIDEDLQSRQMAVYGRESMQKLRHAHVLISGLNGLGAEVAKNVILANVKAVTLHDEKKATVADCGSHFYLSEADAGKNRATACVSQMQELNPGVAVQALEGAFPLAQLGQYTIVVAIDVPLDVAIKADNFCRAQSPPIAFIRADIRGLCGSVFVDLAPQFTCTDPTGETIKSAIVESIYPLKEKPMENGHVKVHVQCVEDDDLQLDDGDHIVFSEVEGLGGLNGLGPLPVLDVSKGRKSFVMGVPPAAAQGSYVRGGLITEKRMPKTIAYRSLEAFLADPGELWEVDESKMAPAATSFSEDFLAVFGSAKANVCYGRSGLLHLGFRALDAYAAKHGALPPPVDAAAADAVLGLAKGINDGLGECKAAELDVPERLTVIRQMAMGSRAVLCPMAAIFGGIVGQEVVKAATGKFHPICQGFYFDALECLPNRELPLESEFANPSDTGRHEGQVLVFGRSFQQRLSQLKLFLVGSGALGCEFIKNLALMGVATDAASGAKLTVTDDDIIEKSNLSRQFLFRNHNVGQSKSLSAVQAAAKMNPSMRATALQDRVSPDTEHVFNSAFWLGLDGVVNALDNVKARLYVDQQCVFFGKPLLESGTLGTKCNTQMVIPHLTENYGASRDAPEKEAPQCAVHNFPHNIDQCLVLAQSEFVGCFDTSPRELLDFLEKGAAWVDALSAAQESTTTILDKLRGDKRVTCGMPGGCRDLLVAERCATWAQCVGWARRKFESYFVSRVAQLLHNFPPDAVTGQGVPFWSPPKRVPKVLPFDPSDAMHMQFVVAAANLRAFTFGVPVPADSRDPAAVAAVLRSAPECKVTPFTPFTDASIETDSKEADAERKAAIGAPGASDDLSDEEMIKHEVEELLTAAAALPQGFAVTANEFEKDDDTNHHVDFINAFGNLRARNYGIEEIDRFQAKLKAGRIIPAIATATAMATGFVCLELYKHMTLEPVAMGGRRNLFANLALPGPLITLSEPAECKKITSGQRWDPEMYMDVDEIAVPDPHTLWDKIMVPGAAAMTLDHLMTFFATQHKLKLVELRVKGKAVYSEVVQFSRNGENKGRKLVDLIEELAPGKASSPFCKLDEIMFNTLDGDDVKAATVVLQLA